MTTTLGLLVLGTVLGTAGSRALGRWAWPVRAPLFGVAAWLTLVMSAFASFVWAGLTLAVHAVPETGLLGSIVHACSVVLGENGVQEGLVFPTVGVIVAGGLVGGLLLSAALRWWRQRTQVRRQRALLDVVCVPHPSLDVLVLDHPAPSVFCVPGPGAARVVVSRGALDLLTGSQLNQVLAHERAHLAGRHHLILWWSETMAAVMMGRFGSSEARARVADLLEMHADDAAGPSSRRELAEAVLALAGGPRPAVALGAGGAAVARVRRLTRPRSPITLGARVGIGTGLVALLGLPFLIAASPGLASSFVDVCPFII